MSVTEAVACNFRLQATFLCMVWFAKRVSDDKPRTYMHVHISPWTNVGAISRARAIPVSFT